MTIPLTGGAKARRARPRDLLPWSLNVEVAETRRTALFDDGGDADDWLETDGDWLRLMTATFHSTFPDKSEERVEGMPAAVAVEAQATLLHQARVFSRIHDRRGAHPVRNWEEALKGRGTEYGGNEILLPQKITAAQIAPGLPPPGLAGSIPAESLCVGETRRIVLDPTRVLRRSTWAQAPSKAKVWVEEGDWEGVVRLLRERNLIEPWQDPLRNSCGDAVLNGAFGVQKRDAVVAGPQGQDLPLLRFIVNLIPSNAAQETLQGDVADLPTAGQLAAFSLDAEEMFLTSMTDRAAFFYVFRLPTAWRRFMVLNRPAKWSWLGIDRPGTTLVALTVVAMGWSQAVAICHHIHRNLLTGAAIPRPLPKEREVRRTRPWPEETEEQIMTWLAYIDDLRIVERVSWESWKDLEGTVSMYLEKALDNYSYFSVPGNSSKDILRQPIATSLGERLDGIEGRRDMPAGFFEELISLTFWVLSRDDPSQKLAQILLGRWARVLGLRRAVASVFDQAWRWARRRRPRPPSASVLDEFLQALTLLPTARQDFRSPLDHLVTASDASEAGGAVVGSHGLTAAGVREIEREVAPFEWDFAEKVVTIAYGDELGALRRSLDLLGLQPAASLFGGVSKEGWRVVSRAWPDSEKIDDASQPITTLLRSLRLKAARADRVLILYLGSSGGCGMLERLYHAALEVFDACRIDVVVEGRQSDFELAERALPSLSWQKITLSARPTCGLDQKWSYAISWTCETSGGRYGHVLLDGSGRTDDYWITAGWKRGDDGIIPSFYKPMPRKGPRNDDLAMAKAESAGARTRWQEDRWQWPPSHYRRGRMLADDSGQLRHLCADERDALLGFPRGHTGPCVGSARLKTEGERVRLILLSRAVHAEHLAWLISTWPEGRELLSHSRTWAEIMEKTGEEAPFVQTFVCAQRSLTVDEVAAEKKLVKRVVLGVDHKGSDIRLDTGRLLSPSCWPRISLRPHLWRWRRLFHWPWKRQHHINVLESSAALSALCWRLRSKRGVGKRFLHLLDSQVSQAVLSKRRSTSKILNFVVKRASVLELAASCHLYYAFIRSDWHPADGASRSSFVKTACHRK